MAARTHNPRPPKVDGLVEEAITPSADTMPDEAIRQVAAEITDSAAVAEFVTVGGREFPVQFLVWKQERQFMKVIAPILRYLITAATLGEFEAAFGALLTESDGDLTKLALVVLQTHDATIDETWLDEHARMDELIELVTQQVRKDKVIDTLGKLWGPGVLAVKTLEGLSNLKALTGLVNTAP